MRIIAEVAGERFELRPGLKAFLLALAGSAVLMIGMGYGRFAYTGILPLMLNEQVLSLREGNLAASANYAGYPPARCCWRKPCPRTPEC